MKCSAWHIVRNVSVLLEHSLSEEREQDKLFVKKETRSLRAQIQMLKGMSSLKSMHTHTMTFFLKTMYKKYFLLIKIVFCQKVWITSTQ